MIETFTALYFAHVLADFVFQTAWIAERKACRHPGAMALHIGTVAITAVLATGQLSAAVGLLVLAHLLTDIGKSYTWRGIGPFLGDQLAHLAILYAVAAMAPDLWATGFWGTWAPYWLPGAMAFIAGIVMATRAGGFVVGTLMAEFPPLEGGLPNAGRLIGVLERALVFILVLGGQPEGVGFLIAAKSVLRFGTIANDRAASEYVIIGTLASFGWALLAAYSTLALLYGMDAMPVLGNR